MTPLICAQPDMVPALRRAVGVAIESLPPQVLSALMITGWVPHGREEHRHVLDLAATAASGLPLG